ncbi:MAG: hypothetical protein ACKESB_02975 [Candidatus Hodgkinia cicadicola]
MVRGRSCWAKGGRGRGGEVKVLGRRRRVVKKVQKLERAVGWLVMVRGILMCRLSRLLQVLVLASEIFESWLVCVVWLCSAVMCN